MGAKATVKRKWTYFKQLFDYAVACDQIKQNPCAFKNGKMPFHGNTVSHTERLNDLDEVIAKVLEHAPERYRLAMIFAAYTGLRAGEQIALTWDDIDFKRKKINVDKAKKKTGLIGCPKARAEGARLICRQNSRCCYKNGKLISHRLSVKNITWFSRRSLVTTPAQRRGGAAACTRLARVLE